MILAVDNDYKGGVQFIGGEAFVGKKIQKRRQTREEASTRQTPKRVLELTRCALLLQQLYGVFADSDSDGGGGKRRSKPKKDDFAAPVAFVRSDVVLDPAAPPPSSGPGIGAERAPTAGLGLGFRSAGMQAAAVEDDDLVLPSEFGQRLKEAAEVRRKEAEAKAARARPRPAADRDVAGVGGAASFEAHTKGIGSKLLEKMGYKQGQGLGREGTGIARALETKLRPKGMGMGFGDYVEQPGAKRAAEAAAAAAAAEVAGPAGPLAASSGKAWKRRAAESRQRRVYKTAEELLSEREANGAEGAEAPKTTIIDMRGAHARVLTNLSRIAEPPPEAAAEDEGALPELQHNLRLIVDLAESEIQNCDRRQRHEKDTAVILGREAARLRSEVAAHAARAEQAAQLLTAVEATASLPPDDLAAAHWALRRRYKEEWELYGLANVALAQALPALGALFEGWVPLAPEPARRAAQLAAALLPWRQVLETSTGSEAPIFADAADCPYARLLAETAMPALRSAVINVWEPRQPEGLLQLLEALEPALPSGPRAALLEGCVMPKLRATVETWDPRTESLPIHAWLHPWLPLLTQQLESLYEPIRFKLGAALGAWDPSDGSALALLAPWQRVFSSEAWEALLVRFIAPKLGYALQQLVINPAAQELAPLQCVLTWAGALPARHMASLLEAGFFPKWHATLHAWLTGRPDYDQVTRWFLGWKALFPDEILAHEKVRRGFNTALDFMNAALAGDMSAHPPPPASMPPPFSAEPPPQQPPLPASEGAHHAYGGGMSLRELVANFAAEHDVLFMPKPGRTERGLQVYGFGKVSCIVDNAKEEIWTLSGGVWTPSSLDQLLARAR